MKVSENERRKLRQRKGENEWERDAKRKRTRCLGEEAKRIKERGLEKEKVNACRKRERGEKG